MTQRKKSISIARMIMASRAFRGLVGVLTFWFAHSAVADTKIRDGALPKSREEVTLSVKSDAVSYEQGQSIFLSAEFRGDERALIQLSNECQGSDYFVLFLFESSSGRLIKGLPFSKLQFVDSQYSGERTEWLSPVRNVNRREKEWLERQLVAFGERLKQLPVGRYQLRIGYGLRIDWLESLLQDRTRQQLSLPAREIVLLDGAFDRPLLSDAIEIEIVARIGR